MAEEAQIKGGGSVSKHNRHLLKDRDFIPQIVFANLIPPECALVVVLKLQCYNYCHDNSEITQKKLNCER